MITQTTEAGQYLDPDLYYSYQAVYGYQNLGEHQGSVYFFHEDVPVPVIRISVYDDVDQLLLGFSDTNQFSRKF